MSVVVLVLALALAVFLSFLSGYGSIAQDDARAPHGLHNDKPLAMSPLAHDFFHPKVHTQPGAEDPCAETTDCSPNPLASTVASSLASENRSQPNATKIGVSGIAGTASGLMFVVLVGTGIYYITVKRRVNQRSC